MLVPGSPITDRLLWHALYKKLKELKPDVIHSIDDFILPAVVAANRKLQLPLVVTCHNNVREYTEQSLTLKQHLINRMFNARNKQYITSLENVDILISVSDYIKSELMSVGVKENRITTIHNIILTPNVTMVSNGDHTKPPIQVFSLGRLVREKGFSVLLDAIKIVAEKEPAIKLVIAGTGPEETALKSQIKRLNLESFVEMVGWVSRERLNQLYAYSDIVLLPSTYPDPCPLVAAEALSFAKPIIASDTGGIPEVVVDGVNGFLVPPENPIKMALAILRLSNDRSLREFMGQTGLSLFKKEFNSQDITRRTIELYKSVLTGR